MFTNHGFIDRNTHDLGAGDATGLDLSMEPPIEALFGVEMLVHPDRTHCRRDRHPNDLAECIRTKVAVSEGAGADDSAVCVVPHSNRFGEIRFQQFSVGREPVDRLLLRRNCEHLWGDVDPVDDELAHVAECYTDDAGTASHIEHRSAGSSTCVEKDLYDILVIHVSVCLDEVVVVGPSPFRIQSSTVIGRLDRVRLVQPDLGLSLVGRSRGHGSFVSLAVVRVDAENASVGQRVPSQWHGLWRIVQTACCSCAIVALGAQPLAAHVLLVASIPSDGETLTSDVDSITLRFDQEVSEVVSATIESTDGERLPGASIEQPEPNVIALRLDPPIAATGTYIVRYEVRAGDNDVNTGGIAFRRQKSSNRIPVAALLLGIVPMLVIGLAFARRASQK